MTSSKGRTYRRCACRDDNGKQYGVRCPALVANAKHGRWYLEVLVPTATGGTKQIRRGSWATKREAEAELRAVLGRRDRGITENHRMTLAQFLAGWLADQSRRLKPTTMRDYRKYVERDIVPVLGHVALQQLGHDHVRQLVEEMEAAGRGPTAIRRCVTTLSSAMRAARRQNRITVDPTADTALPAITKAVLTPWSADDAVRFLDHITDDPLGPVFEVMVGCGLRRGEALALRWCDVDLDAREVAVLRTLSDVDGQLVFSAPKTRSSEDVVGLPTRVVEALRVQRMRQDMDRAEFGTAYQDADLVFARADGAPLRPDYVSKRFLRLCGVAGVPRIRVHDLRHTCATLLLANGVPLALVSKVLRHSQVSITIDLYGHLTREVAQGAADVLGAALDAAAAERAATEAARRALAEDGPGKLTTSSQGPGDDEAGSTRRGNPLVRRGAPRGNRTPNPLIKSQLLCLLS
jgi:integrase